MDIFIFFLICCMYVVTFLAIYSIIRECKTKNLKK